MGEPPPSTTTKRLPFIVHVLHGRWFSLFASFLVMTGAGATYLFSVYSKDIKSSLGYDQTTLNLLGANSQNFANTGALVTSVSNFPESRGVVLGLLK
ncbi:protein nuclear fusion defective 4, partial [Tanacetum coccineum]